MNNNFSINDIKHALTEVTDLFVGRKHSDDEVALAETELGVMLPKSFKEYLKVYGNLSLGPTEYYGLTNDSNFQNSGIPNFVWFTLEMRKSIGLPNHLIVFQNANDEVYYCLDTSSVDANGECNIVSWDNINRNVDQELDVDFFTFLLGDIEEHIELFQ